jgi:prepilin-type N-terminal cleavage/methylation domain-containing protein
MTIRKVHNHSGFTIVELLIVIVVIAILAALSVVAYNGIQNRA